MKNTLLLLSAVGCLALPTFSHAATPQAKGKTAAPEAVAKPAAPKRARLIYYITRETRAGSQIPLVYRSYGGHIDGAFSPAIYNSDNISATGALDVGTALYKLDPSITVNRGH